MKPLWPPLLLLLCLPGYAQLPYTEALFEIREEKNIPYGTVLNFAGQQQTLELDLYKPVGDGNCRRPLAVMIHGGAWIAGTRADGEIVQLCRELARRGYVAASLTYRLGSHKLPNYTPYALCNDNINILNLSKCVYAADTAETLRAAYRAMQDGKGAIRFLKGRHLMDSTDVYSVFVGGVSAGGFTAMLVGYLDDPSEKPLEAGPLPDAPNPDADLVSCLPATYLLARPDLGDIEGPLHRNNGFDASVKGVANFYGGVFSNLFSGSGQPMLYLYHQRKDVIVNCDYKRLLADFYSLCINPLNLCQPLTTMPRAYGSCGIVNLLGGAGATPAWVYDDIDRSGAPNCLANPPGHSIINPLLRIQRITDFWAPAIAAAGNTPPQTCATSLPALPKWAPALHYDPQAAIASIESQDLKPYHWRLLSVTGVSITSGTGAGRTAISLASLPAGIYLLQATGPSGTASFRLIH